MASFMRQTQYALLKRAVLCLVFIGFFAARTQAQGILPPVITPPIVLPSVLSSGGAVTNGGIAIITTTITTLTTLKGVAWYCNGKLVPSAKSALTSSNLLIVSTLTLTNVGFNDAGQYTLRATNLSGSAISAPAVLLVANLVNTVVTTVTNVVSFVSEGTGMTENGFRLRLSGPAGSNVVVQATSDLIHWTPISTNTISGGNTSFTDTTARSRPGRYYRAYIQ